MSISDRIRELNAQGYEKAQIAKELGIRYQHVYNVLKHPLKSDNSKIPSDALVSAGLELMRQENKQLTRVPGNTSAMIFRMADGKTVRMRTSNDRMLIVIADKDDEDDPELRLSVDGTDYVLAVMPKFKRSHGPVEGYLIPAEEVAEAAKSTHRAWKKGNPKTKGANTTWNLWFDDDGPEKANGFARVWEKYRLKGSTSTDQSEVPMPRQNSPSGVKLGSVIAAAKAQIAEAAGVAPEAVRITVDY